MTSPPDMVLFDCDGVLVDSERLTAQVLCANLQRHDLTVTVDDISTMFLGGTLLGVAQTARDMGARLSQTWVDDTYAEIFAALAKTVEVVPGVWPVLDRLDALGVPYAVCSNGPHRKMQITLGRTGLIERLQGRVYSREDVQNPKPDPDIYLKAAADHDVPPARCVVIEDSVNGARAGRAAGMRVLGYVAEAPASRMTPHCHVTFHHMDELLPLLRL